MKRTVEIEFPDDFEFPLTFDYGEYDEDYEDELSESIVPKCHKCPLRQVDRDLFAWRGITKSGSNWNSGNEKKPCPFYKN